MTRDDATRIDGPWLTAPEVQRLFDVYAGAGHPLYLVGGCVRNALMGRAVADIDMASPVPPDAATSLLERAGMRVVPTGIAHGTLTVPSGDWVVEVTTYRRDVATDGRRAVVAFAEEMAEDAARRDFTINALYADRDGAVIDPVGGLADIDPPRIRFIGAPEARLREDYLRALRFFRFHAHYAADSGFDPEALAGIAATLDGIPTLSRERVGAEMTKLLGAPDPAPAVAGMVRTGLLSAALPGADDRALGPLVHLEAELGLGADPVLRLAAIAGADVAETLRLSRADLRRLATLRAAALGSAGAAELGYRLGAAEGKGTLALRHAFLEEPLPERAAAEVARGAAAEFPLSARDLQPQFSGPALGEALREREARWIASDFSLDRRALLG